MRKIDQLTNQYKLTKTLRFELIPEGETEKNFNEMLMLEEDEQRAEEYAKVKEMIDKYHRAFIESTLNDFNLDCVSEYADLYYKSNKTDSERKQMEELAKNMRKAISKRFKNNGCDALFKEALIKETLPKYNDGDAAKVEILKHFRNFTTYFSGFHENRKNIYSGEGKSTEVAYRIVDQNLPKFLDNAKIGKQVYAILPVESLEKLEKDMEGLFGDIRVKDIFDVDFYNFVLTQSGIDAYNQIIGGYTNAHGSKTEKIQGLNEYINLYNQKNGTKLPKIKQLYKQILSDRSSVSFIPEKFKEPDEVIEAIRSYSNDVLCMKEMSDLNIVCMAETVFSDLKMYDAGGIYVESLSDFSHLLFGDWSVARSAIMAKFDAENNSLSPEKLATAREKYLNAKKRYSLSEIIESLEYIEVENSNLLAVLSEKASELADNIKEAYSNVEKLLNEGYKGKYKLNTDKTAVADIKAFLDSIKDLQHFVKIFDVDKEASKDDAFYADMAYLVDRIDPITPLYNKVRDYMTQKPYSDEKIKLNFSNPKLLAGWSLSKETDYCGLILRDGAKYLLGIINPRKRGKFGEYLAPKSEDDVIEKMVSTKIPKAANLIQNLLVIDGETVRKTKKLDELKTRYLPKEINSIRMEGSYLAGNPNFKRGDLNKYIEYYSEILPTYSDYSKYNLIFRKPSEYTSFKEFTDHIDEQAYLLQFQRVSKAQIIGLVDEGALFLFRIYNKDMSEFSKGKKNLHTSYFEMLFDEQNLSNLVYGLCGEAEIFYRKASINKDEQVVHKAGQPIQNKNPNNAKETSVFEYDIIKDRRYTARQFSFHLPININYKATERQDINGKVRCLIKETTNNHIIGIDRGERNLIYVSVIDESGRIVEQKSLNLIGNMDYQKKLDEIENLRQSERRDWRAISNIKNVKEGYVSQAVHEICKLIVKYDAIVAMEDLNKGFKNSRSKFEKQVYQKFEKMLIDKLNFMVMKDNKINECGGLLKGYQLTNKFESFEKIKGQNGILFYVPAWLTSKIDPTTGFVDLLYPKYQSVEASKAFFSRFDTIAFNPKESEFAFSFCYDNFPGGVTDYRKNWVLTTYGKRIEVFKDWNGGNVYNTREVDLSEEFKMFFDKYSIDYKKENLKEAIARRTEKDFFKGLIHLMRLLLQMRNSSKTEDYLISPVVNSHGKHYCSKDYVGEAAILPVDADANGAYHIAKKALWVIEQIKASAEGSEKINLSIKKNEWLEYVQKNNL